MHKLFRSMTSLWQNVADLCCSLWILQLDVVCRESCGDVVVVWRYYGFFAKLQCSWTAIILICGLLHKPSVQTVHIIGSNATFIVCHLGCNTRNLVIPHRLANTVHHRTTLCNTLNALILKIRPSFGTSLRQWTPFIPFDVKYSWWSSSVVWPSRRPIKHASCREIALISPLPVVQDPTHTLLACLRAEINAGTFPLVVVLTHDCWPWSAFPELLRFHC